MSIETGIFTRLSNFAGLTALVSARIYPVKLPQKPDYPAVTFTQVSVVRDHAMVSDPNIVEARYQFDAWAETKIAADAVREQLRAALKRWRNAADPLIFDTFLDIEQELYEDDVKVYHLTLDAILFYREGS